MDLPEDAALLRIFVGEADRLGGKPLFEAIVLEARSRGLAGATVLRGMLGFGGSSRLHTTKVLQLSDDLPIVIEIVDREENLEKLLPWLDEVVSDGLVTLERVRVKRYAATSRKPRA
jgi:PII-like signaling protein